ncbi:hypothetical protein L226DRAFT_615888 [Lentinus tigrinus ALCF2SS1-7]|uniref:Survival Motor Neuron Gemin2-binding domain-containing protein n=1 Tax=Lentinus tigrinus ALCF2SS1-6 TaxID=1328759 RepID=A0A5C2S6B9_9APHY|nr:hypothetical protein L227DRAFT_611980 [Lentinus tigrinus ALCF2SS1-6]RPD70755.1 hypothetical protein L226DRAFT_615888 [Lentinus tigrinus ALCF2SS1-7]
MRPLISYDDITTTPQPAPTLTQTHTNATAAHPPPKKRKTTPNQRQGGFRSQQQHWDDPGNQALPMTYDDTPATASPATTGAGMDGEAAEYYEEEEEEESRELTHDEIWDDSALIDAWNSAAAEYEAYHGPGKDWKKESVKKSPLWYNVPPAPTSKSSSKQKASGSYAPAVATTNGTSTHEADFHASADTGANSTPLNFDTFVPSHDPSLAAAATVAAGPLMAVPTMDGMSGVGTGSEMAMVSQDEAFSRAMTAMYWSGYWTAIYHSRRNEHAQQGGAQVNRDNIQQEEESVEEDEDEDMLPAQR